MAAQPQKSTGEQFSLRLKAFYAALFLTLGVQLPFLPLWLTAKGLDAGVIGIVLAIPAVIRIVAIPVASRIADRRDAVRGVIILASASAAIGFGALAFAQGAAVIMLVYAVASAAYAPVMMLADTYALRGLAQHGRAYGPVRLWGSAAFIAASFSAGALLDWMAPVDLIWLMVSAMAVATAAALALLPLSAEPADSTPVRASATGLLRNPAFLAAIAAASLVQASHALYYGFSTIDWQAAGYDGGVIGALWALGVISEIALFALSARLPSTITPLALLLAGAAGAVLRWIAMAAAPPAILLPMLQCLHALSFGATHLGALALVARMAPPGLGATAQGYVAIAHGVTMAVATALAGMLYGRIGSIAYVAMAVLAAAGGLSALAARRLGK